MPIIAYEQSNKPHAGGYVSKNPKTRGMIFTPKKLANDFYELINELDANNYKELSAAQYSNLLQMHKELNDCVADLIKNGNIGAQSKRELMAYLQQVLTGNPKLIDFANNAKLKNPATMTNDNLDIGDYSAALQYLVDLIEKSGINLKNHAVKGAPTNIKELDDDFRTIITSIHEYLKLIVKNLDVRPSLEEETEELLPMESEGELTEDEPVIVIPHVDDPTPPPAPTPAALAIQRQQKILAKRSTPFAKMSTADKHVTIQEVNKAIQSKIDSLIAEANDETGYRTARDAKSKQADIDYTDENKALNWQALAIYKSLNFSTFNEGATNETLACTTTDNKRVFSCSEQKSTDGKVREIIIKPAAGTLEFINTDDDSARKSLAIAGTAIIDATKTAGVTAKSGYAIVRLPNKKAEDATDNECRKVLLLAHKVLLAHMLPKVDEALIDKLQDYYEKLISANETGTLEKVAPGISNAEFQTLGATINVLADLKSKNVVTTNADEHRNILQSSIAKLTKYIDMNPDIKKRLEHPSHPLHP